MGRGAVAITGSIAGSEARTTQVASQAGVIPWQVLIAMTAGAASKASTTTSAMIGRGLMTAGSVSQRETGVKATLLRP
jgi:hypothetical protein